jgi:hypothetical protein
VDIAAWWVRLDIAIGVFFLHTIGAWRMPLVIEG